MKTMRKTTYHLVRLILIFLLVVVFTVALALVVRFKTGRLIVKINPAEIAGRTTLSLENDKGETTTPDFIVQKDGAYTASLSPGRYQLTAKNADYLYQTKDVLLWGGRQVLVTFGLAKVPEINLISPASRNLKNWFVGRGIVYQDLNQKKLLNISKGVANELTPPSFGEVDDIIWQPQRNLAVVKKAGGETGLYDFARYDLLNQEYFPWSNDIQSVSWRADGERVIYVLKNKKETTLIKANKDNGAPERFLDLSANNFNNPQLVWSPLEERVLLIENGVSKFNVITKELTKIIDDPSVTGLLFSPDGEKIFLQSGDSLKMADKEGKNIDDLGKIKWGQFAFLNNSEIVYFSPEEHDLPLYKYNFLTKEKTYFIYKTKQDLQPEKIVVDDGKKKIYFLAGGNLYSLELLEASYY